MKKITPHLWYDREAVEAAKLYCSLIPGSKVTNVNTIHNTPSGDCDIVSFELAGQPFMAISAGPLFKFNPSISFHVKCTTAAEVDKLWNALSKGGTVMMDLGEYPFSRRFGWCADKYGLSWQIMLADGEEFTQRITPVLLFVGDVCGKAEEALRLYRSAFRNSEIGRTTRYGKEEPPEREGTLKYAQFMLDGQEFGAMDSAREHKFGFNEAVSFIIPCESQAEIDHYWGKLAADPNGGQCGWVRDKFGVCWQITPTVLAKMLSDKDPKKVARVTEAFLPMRKFDIAKLEKAFNG